MPAHDACTVLLWVPEAGRLGFWRWAPAAERQPLVEARREAHALALAKRGCRYAVELRHNNPTDPGYRHAVDKSCLEKLRHSYIVCHGRCDGSVQVRGGGQGQGRGGRGPGSTAAAAPGSMHVA